VTKRAERTAGEGFWTDSDFLIGVMKGETRSGV